MAAFQDETVLYFWAAQELALRRKTGSAER